MNMLGLIVFPLLMAYAASSDLLTMRISNKVILALLAGFVVIAIVMRMPFDQLVWHLAAGALVLVIAFAFFAFGWIGGGDAKLAAATALWVGFSLTLPYVVYASVFGGALTLFILLLRRWPLPLAINKVDWIAKLHHPKTGIPYGIALAASGLVVYAQTEVFAHFAV